jgi:murein DD-endopeptidase MepM/ murein hydrolase activator NlpD
MPASAGKATDCEALRELLNVSSAQVCEPAYSDGTPLPTAPSTGDGSSDAAEVILCLTGSACTLTQDYLTVGSWNPTQGDVHAGLDYGTGAGVETLAGVAGEVIRVDPTGLGLIAIYLPERDLTLVFLHMSAIDVVTGQVVTPTTVVGRTGAVGTPGGAHLHVELRLGRRGYAVGEPSGEVAAITLHPAEVVDCQ